MGDGFRDAGRIKRLDRQAAGRDDPAGKQAVGRRLTLFGRCHRIVPENHVRGQATADLRPIQVASRDGVKIRQIYLLDEVKPALQQLRQLLKGVVVDRVLAVQVDGGRHAADDVRLRVRVLPAEERVHPDVLALEVKCVEIVAEREQVELRAEPVGDMAPVAVGERADIAACQERLEPGLDRGEEPGRRTAIVGDGLREDRRALRIGLQRRCRVDPVKRLEVVEVHDVVVDVLRRRDELPQQPRVQRRHRADGVLDRPHRGERVHGRADTADPLREKPCVPRVPALHYGLDAAPHRGGRVCLGDPPAADLHLDAQVSFDAGHRIDDEPCHCAYPSSGCVGASAVASPPPPGALGSIFGV